MEMQMKATVRYSFAYIRITNKQTNQKTNAFMDVEQLELSYIVGRRIKLFLVWESDRDFL